jgi:shikimate kinase
MRAAGKVVWLTARPETIHARMSGDATTADRRPNLTARAPLAEIVHLLAVREPIYRDTADFVLDTENRKPEELADEIVRLLDCPSATDKLQ